MQGNLKKKIPAKKVTRNESYHELQTKKSRKSEFRGFDLKIQK